MTTRREFATAAGLCGAGAGLVLLASGRTWVRATVDLPRPLPDSSYPLTGGDLAPAAGALGLAGLAGLAGMVATRGHARLVVGVLVAVFGGAVIYASLSGRSESAVHGALVTEAVLVRDGALVVTPTAWWTVAVAGGALLAAAGALTALRGRGWSGLSRRYDAPRGERADYRETPSGAEESADMWDSLDRGRDPTSS